MASSGLRGLVLVIPVFTVALGMEDCYDGDEYTRTCEICCEIDCCEGSSSVSHGLAIGLGTGGAVFLFIAICILRQYLCEARAKRLKRSRVVVIESTAVVVSGNRQTINGGICAGAPVPEHTGYDQESAPSDNPPAYSP